MTASTESPMPGSPFTRAATRRRRVKLFVWGDSGAGKSTLALQFPKPAVIDLEGGTDLYGGRFAFDVLGATTADDVARAVTWLGSHEHGYETLVIDPITVYWDALQRKWSDIFLRRNRGTRGHKHEFYDLQPKDWMAIKAELKALVRDIIALDMHVVVTARQKTQYADGGFMRAVGETFDGEKSLPYLFDTIVQLYRDNAGHFMGRTVKDRSGNLPQEEFETAFAVFETLLRGGRDATP